MRINNNIMAMNTHRQYTINTNSVAKSMEKLSSGYRVNRAGDDAAGLAISEKMRAQIRGLQMASKNSSDAISLVQTAEGALQESHNILQRMRELAVQSSSDTNETSIDRAALNAEFKQLMDELDDTANKAKFNDMGVIDGSYGSKGSTVSVTGYDIADYDTKAAIGGIFLSAGSDVDKNAVTFNANTTNAGKFTIGYTSKATGLTTTKTVDITADDLKAGSHTINFDDGSSITYQLRREVTTDTTYTTNGAALANALGSANFNFDPGKQLTIQTGANQGDELSISIERMDSETLGLRSDDWTANIATDNAARDAITMTNTALNLVSTQRSKLGALQNRLNHKISNLDTSAENLSAAESRIRDLDMAWEMTNFTRNNILTQASTAMLAQANVAPQGVLSLLG